jgi:hypothetical protein
MQLKSAGKRQMLQAHRPGFLTRRRTRLLVALVALGILASAVGLRALHQPAPREVWSDPAQDGALQPEIGSAGARDEALGQSDSGGPETAGSLSTNHDTGSGKSQGGGHGSGK